MRSTDDALARLEQHLGRLLITGVAISAAALVVGVVLYVLDPSSPPAGHLLAAGLVILMATPMLRVVVSIVEYVRMGDWFFVLATLVVLGELALSVSYAMRR